MMIIVIMKMKMMISCSVEWLSNEFAWSRFPPGIIAEDDHHRILMTY